MKKIILILLLLLAACTPYRLFAPNVNDIQLDPGKTYANYTITASGAADDPIVLWGNNAVVKCLIVRGDYVTVTGVFASGCSSHGILVTGKNVTIENNTVTGNVTENGTTTCSGSGAWGSAIKGAVGAVNLTVRNNVVTKNCGEGIALTRVAGGLVEGNNVTDNFSVGIYVDNSFGVTVRGNTSVCTLPAYYRNGKPANGIMLGAEDYGTAWGFQFHDNLIEGNVVEKCTGIRWYTQFTNFATPANVFVRNNTFVGVASPVVNLPSWVNQSGGVATLTPTITPTITPTKTVTPIVATPTVECYALNTSKGKITVCIQ